MASDRLYYGATLLICMITLNIISKYVVFTLHFYVIAVVHSNW